MAFERCGTYLLRERLNQGGMADVYVAYTAEGKPVVIRRLLSRYRLNFFKRGEFARGIEVQAKLHHPNIPRVIKLVKFGGMPYAVMELVEGTNMRQAMVRRDPLLAEPLPIMEQLIDGLEYIHRSGYLHLDFKPENIMLSRQAEVKILDFDLAQKIQKHPRPQPDLSGTPAYLAPEQILRRPVDERTDIFSLGVTLFELFTGKKPVNTMDKREIFRTYTDFSHPLPSPRTLNPAINPKLNRLISNCLEKHIERRYPTLSMVARDFEQSMTVVTI